jgi:caffeoyl-CoA O-methyltransferase
MSDITLNLSSAVYEYLQINSLRESDVLKKLRADTHKMSAGRMQISPEQGQFMRLLVEILNAKKTLDIGTFTGYSAISVALSLPDDGKVIACDTNIEWTNMARKYWKLAGVENKIDLRIAPALQTLDALLKQGEGNSFDFSFIDADKQNYDAYYEKSLLLLRRGGLIAIDNTLWGGSVADPSENDADTVAIRALNAKIHTDERVSMSLLPLGDGLTLARKR